MGLVEGKVALVTGGASGIGRATARLLAKEGASVAVADQNLEGARAVAAELEAAGAKALAIAVDVTDRARIQAMAEAVMARFGRLDAAVNSAGISLAGAPFGEVDNAAWDRNMAINLTGLRDCMVQEITLMLASGGGAIVNLASGAGLKGSPTLGAYVSAKHGVVGATKVAAIDHAKQGIRVNALCPGLILTAMTEGRVDRFNLEALTPMARVGRPEEVAEAAVWLCSDRASFINGVALPVDGGYAAW